MRAAALVLLAAAMGSGCDRGPAPTKARGPKVARGQGVVSGVIELLGPMPEAKEIPITSRDCVQNRPLLDEAIVAAAAPDGRHLMRNVVVYLKDAPDVDLPVGPPVALGQEGCQYRPHVVAVRTGQVLRISSEDPTAHNNHGLCEANSEFNFGLVSRGASRDMTFAAAETFKMKCDVHPWMNAYVAVFDHPFFAVTGESGRFEITGVPPGEYTLIAWQERLGERIVHVTVPPAAATRPAEEVVIRFGN